MPADLQNIRTSMAHSAPPGREPRWHALHKELTAAVSVSLTPEVERLLLDILRFEGELQLDESSEMPHRMSPEDMLKSLAAQFLGKWTRGRYLPTMKRLLFNAEPALACMIRGVIQKIGMEEADKERQAESVAEFSVEEVPGTVEFHLGERSVAADRWGESLVSSRAVPIDQSVGMTSFPLEQRWMGSWDKQPDPR